MLINALIDQKVDRDEMFGRQFLSRDGLDEASKCMEGDLIKVVIGPRRAGKSVFAFQLLSRTSGRDFAYVNFDDERLVSPLDLDALLSGILQVYGKTRNLLFDEIQNVERWELFVNRLQRKGYNIVLTGSNAHLLSQELSTHLTGRYREFRLLPFSFSECLRARSFALDERLAARERQGELLKQLDDFITGGGYPEVVMGGADASSYLVTLFDSILFKDVVKRHRVRYPGKLHDVGHWLAGNIAREYSCTSIAKALAFNSVHTVDKYINYLLEAFLFMSVQRYSPKARVRMKAPRKIYGYDTGMINAVRFRTGRDMGRLMENMVAVELYRRGIDLYTYKTNRGREVDFLIRSPGQDDRLLQVCYDLSDAKTRRRELQALAEAGEELGAKSGLMLTWEEEGRESYQGVEVEVMPVWRWVLGGEVAG